MLRIEVLKELILRLFNNLERTNEDGCPHLICQIPSEELFFEEQANKACATLSFELSMKYKPSSHFPLSKDFPITFSLTLNFGLFKRKIRFKSLDIDWIEQSTPQGDGVILSFDHDSPNMGNRQTKSISSCN